MGARALESFEKALESFRGEKRPPNESGPPPVPVRSDRQAMKTTHGCQEVSPTLSEATVRFLEHVVRLGFRRPKTGAARAREINCGNRDVWSRPTSPVVPRSKSSYITGCACIPIA